MSDHCLRPQPQSANFQSACLTALPAELVDEIFGWISAGCRQKNETIHEFTQLARVSRHFNTFYTQELYNAIRIDNSERFTRLLECTAANPELLERTRSFTHGDFPLLGVVNDETTVHHHLMIDEILARHQTSEPSDIPCTNTLPDSSKRYLFPNLNSVHITTLSDYNILGEMPLIFDTPESEEISPEAIHQKFILLRKIFPPTANILCVGPELTRLSITQINITLSADATLNTQQALDYTVFPAVSEPGGSLRTLGHNFTRALSRDKHPHYHRVLMYSHNHEWQEDPKGTFLDYDLGNKLLGPLHVPWGRSTDASYLAQAWDPLAVNNRGKGFNSPGAASDLESMCRTTELILITGHHDVLKPQIVTEHRLTALLPQGSVETYWDKEKPSIQHKRFWLTPTHTLVTKRVNEPAKLDDVEYLDFGKNGTKLALLGARVTEGGLRLCEISCQ